MVNSSVHLTGSHASCMCMCLCVHMCAYAFCIVQCLFMALLTVRMLLCQCFSCFVFLLLFCIYIECVSIYAIFIPYCMSVCTNFIWMCVFSNVFFFTIHQSASYNHFVLSVKHLHTIEREFVSLLCVFFFFFICSFSSLTLLFRKTNHTKASSIPNQNI